MSDLSEIVGHLVEVYEKNPTRGRREDLLAVVSEILNYWAEFGPDVAQTNPTPKAGA